MGTTRKKTAIIFASVLTLLAAIWIAGLLTGTLTFFKMGASSSAPALKPGSYYFTSSLKKPQLLDFITFSQYNEHTGKTENWAFRLCGLPGDTIEIRNGDLYVNNHTIDDQLNVQLQYELPDSTYPEILEEAGKGKENIDFAFTSIGNHTILHAPKTFMKNLKQAGISYKRSTSPAEKVNEGIQAIYHKPWNEDNFGPYSVPANHYFVLGDNRYRAMDSRYIGPIPVESLTGTVLNP